MNNTLMTAAFSAGDEFRQPTPTNKPRNVEERAFATADDTELDSLLTFESRLTSRINPLKPNPSNYYTSFQTGITYRF